MEELPEEVENNLFTNYYLRKRIKEFEEWEKDEEAEEVFNQIKEIVSGKKNLQKDNEKELQRELIEPVLQLLGHSYSVEEPIPDDGRL